MAVSSSVDWALEKFESPLAGTLHTRMAANGCEKSAYPLNLGWQ